MLLNIVLIMTLVKDANALIAVIPTFLLARVTVYAAMLMNPPMNAPSSSPVMLPFGAKIVFIVLGSLSTKFCSGD